MEFSRSFTLVMCVMITWAAAVDAFSTTMHLERAHIVSDASNITRLLVHDRVRHKRLFLEHGLIFPMDGNTYLDKFYYARVSLGSPPKYYYVLMDTGSSISWINCAECIGCPNSTSIPIQLSFYDPRNSSTTSMISCSDHICVKSPEAYCVAKFNKCAYNIHYLDKTNTSGIFVSDFIHMKSNISDNSGVINSVPIIFGCSIKREEDSLRGNFVDGIFGFDQSDTSIISQLADEGITPKIFAHCLNQDNIGGGSLSIGRIVESGIVYTPLTPSLPHYFIELERMYVGNVVIESDPSVVQPANTAFLVDSGTTLMYFSEITSTVSGSASSYISMGLHCYDVNSSALDIFPHVSLQFIDDAILVLDPLDYLYHDPLDSPGRFCVMILPRVDGRAILGDVAMKDKIIIYDLEAQRIGWVKYNCSLPMKVSNFNKRGRHKSKISSPTPRIWLIISGTIIITCIIFACLVLLWRHKFVNMWTRTVLVFHSFSWLNRLSN